MKKIVVGILIVVTLTMFREISIGQNIIPNEAIRLRVLANSNSSYDQEIKEKVSAELQGNVYSLLKKANNIDEARTIIKSNLDTFNNSVSTVLKKENYSPNYTIDFGSHYFPDKQYKGIKYDKGYYESLLVKIGEGKGNNWWCVLFPPLCLLEAEESTDVEYKFFVQELIDKFF
jgi:stage II sporulation protein R